MIQQKPKIPKTKPVWWLIIHKDQILLDAENQLPKQTASYFSALSAYFEEVVEVGRYQGEQCLMIDTGSEYIDLPGLSPAPLRNAVMAYHDNMLEYIARAWQVALFLRTHRYCGQCGNRMQRVSWELATQCHTCQHRCYPRISPCIIVAIRKDNKILLARGPRHKEGLFSILAGFVESGETLEQAAHREVFEEVGIKIKNLAYFSSQPWPFPHALMMGFLAEYDSGEITPEDKEIEHADWFDIDHLPETPKPYSIAGRLIKETLNKIQQLESRRRRD